MTFRDGKMAKISEADVSLSFLDVLTNGMGSLLVLFFLMAALHTSELAGELEPAVSEGSKHETRGRNGVVGGTQPFVILVTAQPRQALFAGNPGEVLRIAGDPEFLNRSKQTIGHDHAMLFCDRVPLPGTTIRIEKTNPAATLTIRVFYGKKTAHGWSGAGSEQPIDIWPASAQVKKS